MAARMVAALPLVALRLKGAAGAQVRWRLWMAPLAKVSQLLPPPQLPPLLLRVLVITAHASALDPLEV